MLCGPPEPESRAVGRGTLRETDATVQLPRLPRPRLLIFAALALALMAVPAGLYVSRRPPTPPPLPFSEFLQQVESGGVTAVTFGERTIDVTLRDGRAVQTTAPPEFLTANSLFYTDLVKRQIKVEVTPVQEPGSLSYGAMAVAAAFFGLLCFTVYRMTAGRIPSMCGRARVAERGSASSPSGRRGRRRGEGRGQGDRRLPSEPAPLLDPRRPRPEGRPARRAARHRQDAAGAVDRRRGGRAVPVRQRLRLRRDVCRRRRGARAAPVQGSALATSRASCSSTSSTPSAAAAAASSLSHEEREQTLNQLLVEMDGFAPHRGIVVMAATNRQDILDPALLRPGRFDRQVTVGRPGLKGREAILECTRARWRCDPRVDLRSIARGTPGFSGADLANVVNEAALLAGRGRALDAGWRGPAGGPRQGADGRRAALDRHDAKMSA